MADRPGLIVNVAFRHAAPGALPLDVAFDVPAGVTVLFGPSGSGKSTTLALVAGLLRPLRGHVAVGGQVLFDSERGIDVPVHRRGLALVFQSLALFPHMTAEANVAYGLRGEFSRAERRARAVAWLERMRVSHLVGRRPRTFSGGEAQRVALARALASEPRALLLDEPFSAMDVALRVQLGQEVSALAGELELPVLLVTHDRDDALRMGARGLRIADGRIVGQGPVDEIVSS